MQTNVLASGVQITGKIYLSKSTAILENSC